MGALRRRSLSCLLLLLAACGRRVPPAVPVRAAHGARFLAEVALTFDACSSRHENRFEAAIPAALRAARAPATFFLGGRWMEANPGAVRTLAAEPRFELAVHGWDHRHPAGMTAGELCADLDRCREDLRALTGREALLWRPPYGQATSRDANVAAGAGLSTIEYDVASGDPDPAFSARRLERWVLGRVRPGSIIVFHVNGRGVHTAAALPAILAGLKARGLACVTVGALLADGAQLVEHDRAPAAARRGEAQRQPE